MRARASPLLACAPAPIPPPYIAPLPPTDMARKMSGPTCDDLADSVPSEAGLEANVLRYLARWIERRRGKPEGWATITLPTQREEKRLAVDAYTRMEPGRYVALQFKRPQCFKGGTATFCVQEEQLCTLGRYPRGSAFYVLPVVASNREMWRIRTGLLDRTRLVDARGLLRFCRGGPCPQASSCAGKNEMKVWIDRCGARTARIRVGGHDKGCVRVISEAATALWMSLSPCQSRVANCSAVRLRGIEGRLSSASSGARLCCRTTFTNKFEGPFQIARMSSCWSSVRSGSTLW